MAMRRRDDLGRHPEEVPEDPAMKAHEERLANARLSREIGASQQLAGTNSMSHGNRFDTSGYERVRRFTPQGVEVIDWEKVSREQLD